MITETKDRILKAYSWTSSWTKRIIDYSLPFMLIITFAVSLPYLTGTSVAWLYAFCILMLALEVFFNRVEKEFKKEITTIQLIESNKEQIGELSREIKHLIKLEKKRKQLENRKKKHKDKEVKKE